MDAHELLATDDVASGRPSSSRRVGARPNIPTDVDTMLGWFAIAMCAAVDAERRRLRNPEAGDTPAQKVLREKHGSPEVFEKAVWAAQALCLLYDGRGPDGDRQIPSGMGCRRRYCWLNSPGGSVRDEPAYPD